MALRPADFTFVAAMVRREAAIVLEPGKEFVAEQRLVRLARELGLGGVEPLVDALRHDPYGELHRRVIDAMTTNETMWFRDGHPFDALRDLALPDLVARRPAGHALTIWSAACSTGQEPYSVAMLVREHLPQLAGRVQIIATDLSRDCIARAREGAYSQVDVDRGLSPEALARHFVPRGGMWHVRPEVRRLVTFHELNLTSPWTVLPPALDVVLLRNVLIYFDLPTKQRIFSGVRRALRPDGYLFVGSGENLAGITARFERTPLGRAVAYRPGPVPAPPASAAATGGRHDA